MSIQNEITRISNGISNSYTSVSTKGGTIPTKKTIDNLAAAINTIPSGGSSKNTQSSQLIGNTTSTTAVSLISPAIDSVEKTGTYTVYWTFSKSSTSWGTSYNSTQLEIAGEVYGDEQTFETGAVIKAVKLSNVAITSGQKLTIKAKGGGNYNNTYVTNLIIVEE